MSFLERTELLLGKDSLDKLVNSKIAVFGVGGVGGYAVEALVRSGVGQIDIFDNDVVSESNINRQIIATYDTVGMLKVDVMKNRALSINPNVKINAYKVFYLPDNADEYDLKKYDYIIDAIDTITAKIELIVRADKYNIPIISSMGAGNKLDPTRFEVEDIYKTSVCPLAKVMRKELKNRNIKKLKVVYSKEEAKKSIVTDSQSNTKRHSPGSIAFVPSVVGLIIAGEVIKDITDCR